MAILALILAIGLGFGLACFIFASLLTKSNDIGNSIGEASHYTVGITYDRTVNKMSKDERNNFALSYFRNDEEKAKSEPASDKMVEQKENMYNMSHGIDDSIRNLERR